MKKIYISSENTATLICPHCDKAKVIDATRYLKREGSIKVKFTFKCRHCYCGTEHAVDCDGTDCKQGHTLVALLERRKHFRKEVDLNGKIMDESGNEALINVIDISKKGLLFKLIGSGPYEVGEMLGVSFELDDPQRSKINKDVIIRKKISPDLLGVEFTSAVNLISHSDKAIGFYLMN
jgi:PilZ domain-containing protein